MLNVPAMLADLEADLRAQGRTEAEINAALRVWLDAAKDIIAKAKGGAANTALSEPRKGA